MTARRAAHPTGLRKTLRKTVWWKAPADVDTRTAIGQTLQWGDFADVARLRRRFGDDGIAAFLKAAPDGVLDRRSWTLWRRVFGVKSKPPAFREID